ncbi:heptaprenyl diphosphate synthase [Thermosporothrix hazakensis]|uniref:Heptaprenyl diphosphate synthase n=2 Tax=Thermosporothrix TaxID=768650 RepID=A0A326UGE1_THEHA|nr:polyprenyl synthetase family protein [Thermosporothrix hazakensis]PZW30480.1 heptaprenyl diphosphate synthase [Thermosporothrix hazakensis]BBH91195.1 heptaprenyl diphosphate synthase subunit II [Thermosporothrix sp. COM3]GCE49340.1 heptaprenyl diphosphate synthase subunit II [Thermosporothrix hazakensis]
MNTTAATLSRLFSSIQADLDLVDKTFQERASSGLDILNSASMHALGSPGKRLRTAITLLAGKLKNYNIEKLLPLSVAYEMLHLATLIHDDIVDEAKTRRGQPTVNAVWGDKIAILLGDYYFAKTAGLIADIEDHRIDHLFSDTVATVCEGTILEMMTAGQIDLTIETYYEKIKHKTACLMAACSKGGATVCGASPEEIEQLYLYGLHLGVAFQIIDDILDYTQDQSTIGKPAGNDLRQGMVTLPLIYALQENASADRRQQIQHILGGQSQDEDEIRSVVDWVVQSDAINRSFEAAEEHGAKAREALYSFAPSSHRDILDELVDFVIVRNR